MLRVFIKSIISAVLICGIIGSVSPASAQFNRGARADANVQSTQDMLAWMQQSGQVVQELVPLMGNDLLGALLAPLSEEEEEEDLDALAISTETYAAARDEILARSQANIDALPKPERWNFDRSLFSAQERGIYKASQQQYLDLQDTHNAFASISGEIVDSFKGLSKGEDIDFQPVLGRISETTIRVLLSENRVMEALTAAMPTASPNRNLHEIMMAINNSTIIDMEMLGEYETDIDPISTRQAYGQRMKKALVKVPNLIKSGRKKIDVQVKLYEKVLSNNKSRMTEKERNMLTALIPAMTTFSDSFDIEQQLYKNDFTTATLYLSDKSDAAIELELEAITNEVESLILQRMSIMMSRMSSLQ